MSRRREFDDRLHALRDIEGILRAMKNLALMEQQKLTRFLTTQRRVVDNIEAAAEDFFTFYPEAARRLGKGTSVWLIIGSERGFCGDYNERQGTTGRPETRSPLGVHDRSSQSCFRRRWDTCSRTD